jgi:hypothetical protein
VRIVIQFVDLHESPCFAEPGKLYCLPSPASGATRQNRLHRYGAVLYRFIIRSITEGRSVTPKYFINVTMRCANTTDFAHWHHVRGFREMKKCDKSTAPNWGE